MKQRNSFVNLFTPACLSVKIGGRTWRCAVECF
nr:MAG TPA: hypothetical protein [Caudoviricetes sp.]